MNRTRRMRRRTESEAEILNPVEFSLNYDSKIFLDKRVFYPTFQPSRILHCESQIRELHTLISEVQSGGHPRNMLGVGDQASGKTTIPNDPCKEVEAD